VLLRSSFFDVSVTRDAEGMGDGTGIAEAAPVGLFGVAPPK
jgi:hypothetical protein